MAESVSKTSSTDKRTSEDEGHVRETARVVTSAGPHSGIVALQRALGNKGLTQLLQSNMEGGTSEKVQSGDAQQSEHAASTKFLIQANSESAEALDESVRTPIERATGESLGDVRVHSGPASAAAAEGLGARAYTIGSDIHLGSEARRLDLLQRHRLLAHEAVHTVQQGGQPVTLRGEVAVSRPGDASEVEASRIAEGLSSRGALSYASPSLALRGQLRGISSAPLLVSRTAVPIIQRDIKNDYPVKEGNFRLDLTTESHPGGTSGMSGTIKFKAKDTAPNSDSIRLLQVVRDEDLTTGKDYVWTGGEANRNKMKTAADKGKGVEGGFFVDHSAAAAKRRTKKTDAAVSPYYRDYWPNAGQSQDGSKKGKSIQEASLWDSPGSAGNRRFSFETVAKDTIGGHVYGTVMWGFTISDAAKGTVDHERAVGRNVTLRTTDVAIEKFNEFYRNPGSSKAP